MNGSRPPVEAGRPRRGDASPRAHLTVTTSNREDTATGSACRARSRRAGGAGTLAASGRALPHDGGRKRPLGRSARRHRRRRRAGRQRVPAGPRARDNEARRNAGGADPPSGRAAARPARIRLRRRGPARVYNVVQESDPASGDTRVVGHLPAQRPDLAAAAVWRPWPSLCPGRSDAGRRKRHGGPTMTR